MNIQPNDALLIIDPQNDFCSGGALAVAGGDEIMKPIGELAAKFKHVIISQDWHPHHHASFASEQMEEPFSTMEMFYGSQTLWPNHCVAGTFGADFHPDVMPAVEAAELIIRKGMNKSIDSYSAFYENDKVTSTGLRGFLYEKNIKRLFIVGLAYDFCVAYSALDAVKHTNMEVIVIQHLTRAIDLNGSKKEMTETMELAGVQII